MSAAAPAGLGCFGAVKLDSRGVGAVYELVGRPGVVILVLAELGAHQDGAVLLAGIDVHIALIALVDPLFGVKRLAADRAGESGDALVGKCGGFGGKAGIAFMYKRVVILRLRFRLGVRHTGGEDLSCIRIQTQPFGHVKVGADKGGVVGVAECVVRYARLLNPEMLHCAGKGFLILVSACLKIVDQLQVDPACDPVPVKVMDNNILLHDPLVVAAPGEEGYILAAPGTKGLERVGEGQTVGKTLFVKAGDLFDLIVHTLEVHGLDVDRELLAQRHVGVEFDGADLDDLPTKMNGELVEDGGFGAHGLIPFQIHHNIVHT